MRTHEHPNIYNLRLYSTGFLYTGINKDFRYEFIIPLNAGVCECVLEHWHFARMQNRVRRDQSLSQSVETVDRQGYAICTIRI